MPWHLCLVIIALVLTALIGCADEEQISCDLSDDCRDGHICTQGFCEEVSRSVCTDDKDCEGDYSCVENTCIRDGSPDEKNQETNHQSGNQGQNNDANQDNQEPRGNNPRVAAVYPADGSVDKDLDVQVRLTFDQPIAHEFGRLTSAGVHLKSPDGAIIEADLEYVAEDYEVIVTPVEPLWPGTPYTVTATQYIYSINEQYPLAEEFRSTFTTFYELNPDLRALAELYAPVVYQETAQPSVPIIHSDIPTRLDFDGDLEGSNNLANAMQSSAELPAHIYYSATSTESHYFLHYILYYTSRRLPSAATTADAHFEHDFTGVVVVVNRDTMAVELVEGVHTAQSSSDDSHLSFRPNTSSVTGRTDYWEGRIANFRATHFDETDGGTRFPLYVPSGNHAGCLWPQHQSGFMAPVCASSAGEFTGGEGIILRPGSQAQTLDQATPGQQAGHVEMTYELMPFVDPFWTKRGDFDCGLFSQFGFFYNPWTVAARQTLVGPGEAPLHLPRSLCSDDDDNYGNLPYRWFSANSNGGEWFLDPALALSARFDFGPGFSLDY